MDVFEMTKFWAPNLWYTGLILICVQMGFDKGWVYAQRCVLMGVDLHAQTSFDEVSEPVEAIVHQILFYQILPSLPFHALPTLKMPPSDPKFDHLWGLYW